MRLTLRTMLCYLDDVLEPGDAAELGKRIEDSEYASQVVHRIRTSMRRLRLGAPALVGDKGSFDPNMVADYLDNTLPPEQVADFERICLDPETEVQLAEVAACHQILTLVLGEPAEVPPSMRQRMYDLGLSPSSVDSKELAADAHVSTNGLAKTAAAANAAQPSAEAAADIVAAPAPAAPPAGAETMTTSPSQPVDEPDVSRRKREKPKVPAYLKEGSRRSWWPAALTLLLVAVIVTAAVYVARQRTGRPVAVATPPADPLFNDPDNSDNQPTTDDPATPATPTNPAEDDESPETTTDPSSALPTADTPATVTTPAATADDDTTAKTPPPETGSGTAESTDEPGEEGSVASATEPAIPVPATTSPDAGPPALPLVDKVIGHVISTGQVLVMLDAKPETWSRLATRSGVKPGMHLRSLPTFRPLVLLDNAIQISFVGEGEVVVHNPRPDDTPILAVPFGRVVLATVSRAGSSVVVWAGGREALLTMVNADAAVALEVAPFHVVGVDPLSQLSHVRVALAVTSGQVQWQEAGREPLTLDAGQELQFLDDEPATVAAAEGGPKWLNSGDTSDIDRRASATLEPLLADGPVEIKLEELAGDDPRVEVRSLAMRSLATLGRFDRILESLKDDRLKSYWLQHINHLQAALARDANVAEEVRAACGRANGAQGESLYRLLWGYDAAQLEAGGAKQLVELLKHPSLDMRVVSSLLLRDITGKSLGYFAYRTEASRRTAERQWEELLKSGEVVYAEPPLMLPARKPRELP